MTRYDYQRSPAAIYRESFNTVRREADLSRFDADESEVVVRMVHACGHVPLAEKVDFGPGFVTATIAALRGGRPLLCDCEMVRHGVIDALLPDVQSKPCSYLGAHGLPELAEQLATTRSAAAVQLWRPSLEGAMVLIGNAPTALFALLEGLHAGWARPAAIVGIPVGFVGAAESKAALAETAANLGIPYVTVHGRLGGSAVASAAVNAVARLAGRAP